MAETDLDTSIIERVKRGDTWAFQYLVNKYRDNAYSLACSIVKDPSLADDVLQEVFIKVYDNIKSFKYQSAFYTWLYRIVVNRCYNELRRKKHLSEEWIKRNSDHDEAARLVHSNDLKKMVNTALQMMKPDEALALRLFYLNELSIEESMEVTGFTRSKMKVTLHRGRKSFGAILKSHFRTEIEVI